MLKFLIDHNVPHSVARFLEKRGYPLKLVRDLDPEMSDTSIVRKAEKEGLIIISNDKDFISLAVQYQQVDMILFDFLNQSAEVRISAMKKILPDLHQPFGVLVLQG